MNAEDEEQRERRLRREAYDRWLQSTGVSVASDLVETTCRGTVSGWGCVARGDIEEGAVLFSIPRGACFGRTSADAGEGGAAGDDESMDADGSDDEDEDDDDDDPTTRDTQMEMAISLINCNTTDERGIGGGSDGGDVEGGGYWKPFTNMLTYPPHGLPWTWPESYRRAVLSGTELQDVVECKVERLRGEYEQIVKEGRLCCDGVSFGEYLNACAVVSSHANPWFGVSIVPFNTTLNWGRDANVEFDLEKGRGDNSDESRIVGRTTRHVKKGQELFQSYGNSVAELVYRCGFAPSTLEDCDGFESDVVSIDLSVILSVVDEKGKGCVSDGKHSLNSESCSLKGHGKDSDISETERKTQTITTATNTSSRIQALNQSGLIDESPWDGMGSRLTAELTKPSKSFLERSNRLLLVEGQRKSCDIDDGDPSAYDDGGVSKLVGIYLVLLASDDAWERATSELQRISDASQKDSCVYNGVINGSESDGQDEEVSEAGDENDDDESRTDDIASSILLSSISHLSTKQSVKLRHLALTLGRDGNDPWRALLLNLARMEVANSNCGDGSKHQRKKRKFGQQEPTKEAIYSITRERVPWKGAFEAARSAISCRMEMLIRGEKACQKLKLKTQGNGGGANETTMQGAINTIGTLRSVEKAIIEHAKEALESLRKEIEQIDSV